MLNSGLENLSPVLTWQNAGKHRLVSHTPRPTKHPCVVGGQPGSCVRPPSFCCRCRSYVVGHVESASPRLQGRLRTLLGKNASVRRNVDSYKVEGPFQEGAGGSWALRRSPRSSGGFWALLLPPFLLGDLGEPRPNPAPSNLWLGERGVDASSIPPKPWSLGVGVTGHLPTGWLLLMGITYRRLFLIPAPFFPFLLRISASLQASQQRFPHIARSDSCQEWLPPWGGSPSLEGPKGSLWGRRGSLTARRSRPFPATPWPFQKRATVGGTQTFPGIEEPSEGPHVELCLHLLQNSQDLIKVTAHGGRGLRQGEAASLAGLAGQAGGEDGGRVGGGPGPALQLGLLPAAADSRDGEEVPPPGRGILGGSRGPSLASRRGAEGPGGEGRPATIARAAPISHLSSFRTSRTP
ncbi:hypothetical protein E2320_023062 [Naja naja]|nr:hypothetical protein E2320_023062 [Naja naja]